MRAGRDREIRRLVRSVRVVVLDAVLAAVLATTGVIKADLPAVDQHLDLLVWV